MNLSESVSAVLASQDLFGKLFYEEFFRHCPAAAEHFAGVDMERQALVLTMSLAIVEQYRRNPRGALETYLSHLGHTHHHRGIPPELYPAWREAMLLALARFDAAAWTPELAAQWDEALELVTAVMLRGYAGRSVV